MIVGFVDIALALKSEGQPAIATVPGLNVGFVIGAIVPLNPST